MIVRYINLKDTHHFMQTFIKVNDTKNVIIRDISVMDNSVKCTLSVRDDDFRHVRMHPDYRDVEHKIIDRNAI